MAIIKISVKSEKRDVIKFLATLRNIISMHSFEEGRDFLLIDKPKYGIEFSTPYTLLDLGFDTHDVLEFLKKLTVEEYSETLFDKGMKNLEWLFVFGKTVTEKMIYIKIKIKNEKRKIICLSFHYAKYKMEFPYK